jgi:hypothetical protein
LALGPLEGEYPADDMSLETLDICDPHKAIGDQSPGNMIDPDARRRAHRAKLRINNDIDRHVKVA